MNVQLVSRSMVAAAVALCCVTSVLAAPRTLTFEERVAAQKAIEQVYWSHRIWPADNPQPKPPLSAVMPDAAIRAKVEEALRKSNALATLKARPITAEDLQAELRRMTDETTAPDVLRELYAALGDDPFLVAECLARPALADRMLRSFDEAGFDSWWSQEGGRVPETVDAPSDAYDLDLPSTSPCTGDTWTPTSVTSGTPTARAGHLAVWTGAEMIVWGGSDGVSYLSTGARYEPATATWTPTNITGAPAGRTSFTAVWTGTEMIVWGGLNGGPPINTGGRYNPTLDSWTATSTGANTPSGPRARSVAVWTGSVMIVWGGSTAGGSAPNTGGRYNPTSDTWLPTSVGANVPTGRDSASAVWTGGKMIVWGGQEVNNGPRDTGGLYDPVTDTWAPTSTTGTPRRRWAHTAVWTGSKMIVWGGQDFVGTLVALNSGGSYDPATDTWTPTSVLPSARAGHTAVWTGSQMIVWGGGQTDSARYYPTSDLWVATPTLNAPSAPRSGNAAVGTGDEMIVWGGSGTSGVLATGGRYCTIPCSALVWYRDSDGDGFGDSTVSATGCTRPMGYVGTAGDCDDTDATVRPGAPQLCDGKNNNCTDPAWPTVPANEADADGDGYRICQNDCNDANPNVHPNAAEICNAIDDNCNGQIDENAQGVDTDGDGVHNACDNCPTVTNPTQTDSDGDHVGNACDNCVSVANPSQTDSDGDGLGNACDNCPSDANPSQADVDGDRAGDACDNCLVDFNPSQTDFDHDGQGDVCDVNDGLILIMGTDDKNYIEWQHESGPQTWNVYTGDLSVLRSSGVYTQVPGSNPLASRACGVADVFLQDPTLPDPGSVEYSLVTGVTGGVEGSLGTNHAGTPRPNTNPCP